MKKIAEKAGYTIGGKYTTNNYEGTLVQPVEGFSIGFKKDGSTSFSVGVHEFASEADLKEYTDYAKDRSTLYVSGIFCVEFVGSDKESEIMDLFAAAGWDFSTPSDNGETTASATPPPNGNTPDPIGGYGNEWIQLEKSNFGLDEKIEI